MSFLLVDAFATRPFTGNPAAVVILVNVLPDAAQQAIAMEFNQAETAFVKKLDADRWHIRWFTPNREVPLCGHATLAAAHALIHERKLAVSGSKVEFITRENGTLVCQRMHDGRIAMDFPATPPKDCEPPDLAAKVLDVVGPVACIGTTAMNLTLVLADEAQVRAAKPDLAALSKWHAVGVTITARSSEPGVDFVSRFFAPQSGIPEDPVTGSAHCTLAIYWAKILGKTDFVARQLSPRGGELGVSLRDDRVELRGAAVTTMRGELLLP